MADEKLCTCCGNMVEITPVYAEVGDSESGAISYQYENEFI